MLAVLIATAVGCGRSVESVSVPRGDVAAITDVVGFAGSDRLYVTIIWSATGPGKESLFLVAAGNQTAGSLDKLVSRHRNILKEPSGPGTQEGSHMLNTESIELRWVAYNPVGSTRKGGKPTQVVNAKPPGTVDIAVPKVSLHEDRPTTSFVRSDGTHVTIQASHGGRAPSSVTMRLYVKCDNKAVPVSNAVTRKL